MSEQRGPYEHPPITIGGLALSEGEKTALWVAVGHFMVYVAPDSDTAKELGEQLAANYYDRITDVAVRWQQASKRRPIDDGLPSESREGGQ